MRILFLSYWGFEDPLTTATVLPHLRVLHERSDVESIRLVTIERNQAALRPPQLILPFLHSKISFEPLLSPPGQSVLVTKTNDFRRFPRELVVQARAIDADFIIARGAPAGALAYLVWQKTRLPFYVESFEPHAEYMLQAGVWRRYDPRYLFQQHWENQQKKHAVGLMPVAEHYRQQLIQEGVSADRVITVPCSVDLQAFSFRQEARTRLRESLGWSSEIVCGVYAGKFGGIYYDDEAFTLFQQVVNFFGSNFRLLLLTPMPAKKVQDKLSAVGFDLSQVIVRYVPFGEVPDYLSAADFAFGLHRPTPYVSPIKIGEYWANGLPVLQTQGVGDDSDIIATQHGGAIFDMNQSVSVVKALTTIQMQLSDIEYRATVCELARRHRSLERAREAYIKLLPPKPLTD